MKKCFQKFLEIILKGTPRAPLRILSSKMLFEFFVNSHSKITTYTVVCSLLSRVTTPEC